MNSSPECINGLLTSETERNRERITREKEVMEDIHETVVSFGEKNFQERNEEPQSLEELLEELPVSKRSWESKSCLPSYLGRSGSFMSRNFNGTKVSRKASLTSCAMSKTFNKRGRMKSYLGLEESAHGAELFLECSTTRMQRLVIEIEECFQIISCSATYEELEDWACLIYESMSGPSRTFHSVQHVFDISEDADPIEKLAVFFHDIIYYSIDGGLTERQEELIGDAINVIKDGGQEEVRISERSFDANTNMVIDIFGFKPGQILDPFKGMNEFLSALSAVRCYQGNLEACVLAGIAACIEGTIPFRKKSDDGKSPSDVLFERLVFVNKEYDLNLNDDEIVEAVQRAADLGNRDLDNFSTPEKAVFLSNSWNLLPESNISLRNKSIYRVSDYAFALKKMTGFFEFLDPDTIFLSFRDNEKQRKLIEKKTKMATENVRAARKYMNWKRVSIGVVAAISELSGGDAPLALFLGDLPEPHYRSTSIEDYVEADEPEDGIIVDPCVFRLLKDGRESESSFDIKNSPLAAYLYSLMGDEGIDKVLTHAVHPMDKEHATKLLKSIPEVAVATIVAACAEIAITRADRLDQMVKDLIG